MSVFSSFDLDRLTAERFQELCSSLLVNHFSQLIEPHGRPGRDGGVDAELIGEAISYSDLINRPIPSRATDGSELLWIFQVKHVRQEGNKSRQRAVVTALKKEIIAWKKKRGRKPTHFFLMTNVNLTIATKKELKKLGKHFPRFECWGEEKILPFLTGSVALQNAYFPSFGNLTEQVTKLCVAIEANQVFVADTKVGASKRTKKKGKPPSIKETDASFTASIRKLVEYEVSFLRTNEAFFEQLDYKQGAFEPPKAWTKVVIQSPKDGILVPSNNSAALTDLLHEIRLGNAGIVLWHRYLGEETKAEEDIVTLSCHPEKAEKVRSAAKKLFMVIQGENTAHLLVDSHLKKLQSKLLGDIKDNRIIEAADGLSDLLSGRREYSQSKKQYPAAFYPNMRALSRRPIFGWDFSSLWEDVLSSVVDVAFSGTHPKDLYQRLIHAPFHLCTEAIRTKLPEERFQAELDTTFVIFRTLCGKNNKEHLDYFIDNLDDLATAVADIDNRIETKDDAEWAVSISRAVAQYVAGLGKIALSKKIDLPLDSILIFLCKSTALHFQDLLHHSKDKLEDWRERYRLQKDFEKQVADIRDEYIFALATYSWFTERKSKSPDPTLPLGLLRQISIKKIIEIYQSKLMKDNGWFGWWFNPEGKRASWSSSVDHDIRDSLQLAALNISATPLDYYGLRLLEVVSSYDSFIEELKRLHAALASRGHIPSNDLGSMLDVLAAARKHIEDSWKDTIRQQVRFSDRKLVEVRESFNKRMLERNPEGSLYLVHEGPWKEGEKPTHYVGVYSILDKVWFLEETGYSHYTVSGMGSNWADNLLLSRENLLIEIASSNATVLSYEANNLDGFLDSLKQRGAEGEILMVSPLTIPWKTWEEYFLNEHQITEAGVAAETGRSGRLGNLDLYYSTFIKKGEFLLLPRTAFTWKVTKRLSEPRFELIDLASETGKKLAEQNPEMDLGLKCLIYAREEGTMQVGSSKCSARLYKPSGAAPENPEE